MEISRSGKAVYIKGGSLYDWSGRYIEKPVMCIEGETLLYWGNEEDVEEKYTNLLVRFSEARLDTSSIKIIPLYKKLDVEDCYFVIESTYVYTDNLFIKRLNDLFETDMLARWLSDEKAYKRV